MILYDSLKCIIFNFLLLLLFFCYPEWVYDFADPGLPLGVSWWNANFLSIISFNQGDQPTWDPSCHCFINTIVKKK